MTGVSAGSSGTGKLISVQIIPVILSEPEQEV